MNLKLKLGYLSFQNKIKTFCHFHIFRMRTNAFREEAISDHKVEEY